VNEKLSSLGIDPWLTCRDVAEALACTPTRVRQLAAAGKIKAFHHRTRAIRFTTREVKRYMAAAEAQPRKETP
jgi:excisionase family DNA binding protein